jgi:hypothetical protein
VGDDGLVACRRPESLSWKERMRRGDEDEEEPSPLFVFFYSIGSCERTTFSFLCTNVLEQPFSVQRLISIARHSEAGMSKQIGSWPAEYSSTGSCDLVSNTTASAFERVRRRKLIESVFFFGSVFGS